MYNTSLKAKSMRLNYFMSTLFALLFVLTKPTISWKLELCVKGSKFETSSEKCKYGFWFKEPTVVHKICFEHGVWAIYKEFCEDAPLIWTARPGTKGCLSHDQLGNRIIGAVPIGQDENSGAVVSTSYRRLFFSNHKLKHGMHLHFINAPATVEVLTWGPPSIKFSLQQFINSDRGIVQQCLIKGERTFFGFYRIHVESPKNASLFLAKNVCYSPLTSQTGEGGRRVQVRTSEIDFDILQSVSGDGDDSLNCKQFVIIDDQFEKDQNDYYTDLLDLMKEETNGGTLSSSSVKHIMEKRVDQETQKIGLRLIGYHFRNDKFDKEFYTWEFLNVAKQIFLKACPEEMVPPFFVEQLHLLFQALLHESFRHYPYDQDKDKKAPKASERILQVLQKCLQNSSKLEFVAGENCTDEAPLLRKAVKNGTHYDLLVEMPGYIKVDAVNYDLLMESIWKLMNFAHYYCADHFEEMATDHSRLEDRWYRLFSRLVLRRWRFPGRGYLMFQKIFMSIDLEKSILNLDFCVGAARLHSAYQGWLKRPKTPWDRMLESTSRDTSDSQINRDNGLLWDDQAYCMQDYMDPALKMNAAGNSIEKCGIRTPQIPLRPIVFDNSRGNLIL